MIFILLQLLHNISITTKSYQCDRYDLPIVIINDNY